MPGPKLPELPAAAELLNRLRQLAPELNFLRTAFSLALIGTLTLVACRNKDESTPVDSGETEVVDADGDGSPEGQDCDDTNPDVYPDAQELCDRLDNDCDDQVDEGATSTWYADNDSDGFGDAEGESVEDCEAPSGYVDNNDDCDDDNAEINPDAEEICNGLDNDCDGVTSSDGTPGMELEQYPDNDGDDYGDAAAEAVIDCAELDGHVLNNEDCDDTDDNINPGEREDCNGVDDDCDGVVDDTSYGASVRIWTKNGDAHSDSQGDLVLTDGLGQAGSAFYPAREYPVDLTGELCVSATVYISKLNPNDIFTADGVFIGFADVSVPTSFVGGGGSGLGCLGANAYGVALDIYDAADSAVNYFNLIQCSNGAVLASYATTTDLSLGNAIDVDVCMDANQQTLRAVWNGTEVVSAVVALPSEVYPMATGATGGYGANQVIEDSVEISCPNP